MYIEELKEGDSENEEGQQLCGKEDDSENGEGQGAFLIWDAKRLLVGAGARALFYPTLLYNVVRNKIQSEFRWWDRVDEDHNIKHLLISTRDYLFAPSYGLICQVVEFIHSNTICCKTTYVHCKAGRGRSTTVVLCYLAVEDYYNRLKKPGYDVCMDNSPSRALGIVAGKVDLEAFDDNSAVLITESDLDGYEENDDSLACRVQFASQAAISRLSCL